jgi:hypothetical protein
MHWLKLTMLHYPNNLKCMYLRLGFRCFILNIMLLHANARIHVDQIQIQMYVIVNVNLIFKTERDILSPIIFLSEFLRDNDKNK